MLLSWGPVVRVARSSNNNGIHANPGASPIRNHHGRAAVPNGRKPAVVVSGQSATSAAASGDAEGLPLIQCRIPGAIEYIVEVLEVSIVQQKDAVRGGELLRSLRVPVVGDYNPKICLLV